MSWLTRALVGVAKILGLRGRVGDRVATVTTALGVPPCRGCKERQRAANEAFDGPLTCKHRRHQVGVERCGECRDGDKVAVYGCTRFNHVTLTQRIGPLPTCATCSAREA